MKEVYDDDTGAQPNLWKRIRQVVSGIAISGIVLFVLAGRLNWGWGWVYLGMWLLVIISMTVIVEKNNPGLLASRAERPKDSASWDVALLKIYTFLGYGVLVIAALDGGRFIWSEVPLWLHLLGIAFAAFAFTLNTWAMSVNKYTKTHVAIQEAEGHQVVDDGPYGTIRHPMYSAGLLMWVGIPLVLGSLWALIPGGLSMLVMVVRTVLEDRLLKKDLPGYREYAQQVRYRLIPGIW